MYPRAGKVIETAGQLGSCPQKVLANNASFCVPKGYRTLTEGAFEYEQEEYKKLTPQSNKSGGVRGLFNDMCFLIQLESPKKYHLESLLPMSVFHFGYNHSTKNTLSFLRYFHVQWHFLYDA